MDIEVLLNDEIQEEFEELREIDIGSEEYKTTVDGLTKLIDRSIEFKKFNAERVDKDIERADEKDIKTKQMRKDDVNRWIDTGMAIAGIVIPSAITIWGTVVSLQFEEEGTITTAIGRGFINKLLPKK